MEPQTLLRRYRMKKGLTQEEVAQRLGIGRSTYTKIELGKIALKASLFLRWLRIFNLRLDFTSKTKRDP